MGDVAMASDAGRQAAPPRNRMPATERLMLVAERFAKAGAVMPDSSKLAEMIGVACRQQATDTLRLLNRRGKIRLEWVNGVAVVERADGAWRTAMPAGATGMRRRRGAADAEPPVPPRRCVRCDQVFDRTSRFLFMCPNCRRG